MAMKWLDNTYDPAREDAHSRLIPSANETIQEAWGRHCNWLQDKAIGQPRATNYYTVDELIYMGMVGVYIPEEGDNA